MNQCYKEVLFLYCAVASFFHSVRFMHLQQKIAGYTGWKYEYEYVDCTWENCFDKLKNDELDNAMRRIMDYVQLAALRIALVSAEHANKAKQQDIYIDTQDVVHENVVTDRLRLNQVLLNIVTLSLMKPSAFIINTSRGALIDETALIEALENGTIAGTGLDVQENEPPEENSPLYTMDNVLLTPHMGWKGLETRQRLVSILADNIKKFMEGNPINVVSGL